MGLPGGASRGRFCGKVADSFPPTYCGCFSRTWWAFLPTDLWAVLPTDLWAFLPTDWWAFLPTDFRTRQNWVGSSAHGFVGRNPHHITKRYQILFLEVNLVGSSAHNFLQVSSLRRSSGRLERGGFANEKGGRLGGQTAIKWRSKCGPNGGPNACPDGGANGVLARAPPGCRLCSTQACQIA